jgi:hypothetical protein
MVLATVCAFHDCPEVRIAPVLSTPNPVALRAHFAAKRNFRFAVVVRKLEL